MSPSFAVVRLPLLAVLLLGTVISLFRPLAAEFRISGIRLEGTAVRVTHPGEAGSYYVLYRGDALGTITTPVDLRLGADGDREVEDRDAVAATARFYRVRQVPVATPQDSDGDDMDDLFELGYPDFLNPLDNADANRDFDGDGLTNADEYRRGSDPAVSATLTRINTSPENGDSEVSVNRETVVYFTAPLAANAPLSLSNLYAEFGGRRLLSRLEVASDRRKATLFYLEPLPASSRIRVTLNAGELRDASGQLVDADGDGRPGGVATVDFSTFSVKPIINTAIRGQVFASAKVTVNGTEQNQPLPGVTVTVDGQEETMRAVTDAEGRFELNPAPAGRFFVHVDGRTSPLSAWPNGDYYPFVGKAWEAEPGRTDNLAGGSGEIFLPLVKGAALQPVSTTADTRIQLPAEITQENPALAGIEVTVPANSLFSENGNRGGRVGLAPVPPDRLPEPLPEGLNPPLVITVQTDGGSNFDRPAPVKFPNLPDPQTGEKLPPGAKSALISFNHDTGRWEVQGSMTVTPDGNFLTTDPGVGILQPGWHFPDPQNRPRCDKPKNYPPPSGPPPPRPPNPPQPDPGDPLGTPVLTTSPLFNPNLGNPHGDGPDGSPDGDGRSPNDSFGGDSTNDYADNDAGTDGSLLLDCDGDGIPNRFDPDIDGDGIPNAVDPDADCDGRPNRDDRDDDGDGVPDEHDNTGLGVACGKCDTRVDCGCDLTGDYVDPAVVPPAVRPDGNSPDGTHRLEERRSGDNLQLTVRRNSDGAVRLAFEVPAADVVHGFGPDCTGFVVRFRQRATGEYVVLLFNLGRTDPGIPVYISQRAGAAPAVAFSPAGRWLLEARALSASDVLIRVLDVGTGNLRHEAVLKTSTLPGGGGVATWGFSPDCVNRTFVYAFAGEGGRIRWRMVNLTEAFEHRLVRDEPLEAASGFWQFNRCGSLAGRVSAGLERMNIQLFRTRDGSEVASRETSILTARFSTTASHEILTINGTTEQELAANAANDSCEARRLRRTADTVEPDLPAAQPFTASTGLHYFAIQDWRNGRIIQRGVAGRDGIVHVDLMLRAYGLYRSYVLNAATLNVGFSDFANGEPGTAPMLPTVHLFADTSADRDGDGLGDLGELIMGTDPNKADTDGDGITDGAEVQQGGNATGGRPVTTGIIATAPTVGTAVDVVALNNLAVTANEGSGINVFEVSSGLSPNRIAVVDTPGNAQRVSLSGNFVAVADDFAGLAVVDISDPPAARIVRQVQLGSAALSVTTAGPIAFVGLGSGEIAVVDMVSGDLLNRRPVGGAIWDLAFGGDHLFAVADATLYALNVADLDVQVVGSVSSPVVSTPNRRLFVGGGIAYTTHGKGYNTINVANPASPALIAATATPFFGWKQIVLNGSGLGFAAVSPNFAFDGPHDVELYGTADPAKTTEFIVRFETPGVARSVAIYRGLGYVADNEAGLQVVNYLAFDATGVPPGVSLATSATGNSVEEGRLMRVTANVTDNVQVRDVQFYLDGELVATDGNYPFEHRFIAPALGTAKTSFKLRARATDTGGNTAFSEELTLNLVEDATPPRLVRTIPAHNGGAAEVASVSVFFNEPIAEASRVPANFALTGAGEDGQFNTADDLAVSWPLAYEPTLNQVRLDGPATLVPGTYQLVIAPTVTDVAGNPLGLAVTNRFSVGFGLLAEYFDHYDFTNLRLTRVDPTVNFDWGGGSPDPQIGPDQFAVRWRGAVVPRFTETYTFHTISDDGIRLWVDRQLLVDVWSDHGPTEYSGSITLEAGRRYDLRMEMYENGGGAVAQLLWSSPNQPREVIPASQLVPYVDTEGPYALWAVARPDLRGATLRFTEPLHRPTAEDPANYAVSGAREVLRARLQANGLDVLLETAELPATTDFTVTVTGVRDTSPRGNPVGRANIVPFRTPRIVDGFARREAFFGIPGAPLTSLKASPRYPLEPDRVELTPQTEVSPNIADSFGQRLLGWLLPPVTGDYQFYLSSDNQGELLLSTDETPANLRRIAFEPQWSDPRSWTGGGVGRNPAAPENVSVPVRLQGGQRYYFEANAQEDSGGDHLAFNWSYRPELQAGAFVIEAEDFDFDGGQHKPLADTMPYPGGAYDGAGAFAGVDFSKRDDPSDVYRLGESPNVGLTPNGDSDRGTWTVTTNYKLGWNDDGEWMNYTRNFPAGTYHVYARLSSGGAPMAARLDEVTAGRGTAEQTLTPLGTFTAPATGNWDGFVNVPLRDDGGNPVKLTLGGERTLRFTVLPGNLDFNYLLLVPAPADGGSLAGVPLSPPPNGAAPIPAKFLQAWIGDDGAGQLRRDFFAGNADGAVDSLRSHTNYPARPDFSDLLRAPEPLQGQAEFYGERVTGWLRPPVTGDYRFWVASDDQSELWLSTDATPANLRKLAHEPVWAGFREFNGTSGGRRPEPVNRSEIIRLEAGREYFLEVLHAEHSGGDGLSVTWQLPGDYAVVNGQAPIAGNFFRAFNGPGSVVFLAPPLTQTVHEELPVTFRAHAVGLPPFSYQWFFKGEPIAGATGPTYTLPFLLKPNEGDYSVRVRNPFSEATSGPGTLTVTQDLTPPKLLAAEGSGSMERVRLRFDEELDPTTAQAPENYTISGGLTVDSAVLLPDRKTVVLHTSRQADLTAFAVTVSAVKDDSPTGNPIAGDNSAAFTSWQPGNGVLNREAYFGLGGGGVGDLTGSARFIKGPDEENLVSLFETPPNAADNYGVRLYGWLTPPVDGDYRFFLASDDNGAVFLSTDDSPGNKRQIASETGWRGSRSWNAGLNPDPAQSEPIPLVAGKRYYVETLMKEGGGGDNLAVTWQLVSDFAGAITVEAEDFNFGGGQHLPAGDTMPYFGGAYAGRGAVRDVDYRDPGFSENDAYRRAPNLLGNANATDGAVQLTPNVGGQQGSLILAPDAAPGTTLDVQFELYIGDGSAADGFSFNYGDLPDASFGEQGAGAGLRVEFDTWSNGSADGFDDEANTIEVWYANTRIAKAASITLRTSSYVPVSVQHDGTHLKVIHNGVTIFGNLEVPGWNPQANWRLGWGARTGGASDNHWIRNLVLTEPATTVPPFDQPAVGIYVEPNDRGRFTQSGLTNDWAVGWLENGDWMNYTRTFPAGDYYVLARVASGGAPVVATLSEVTNAGSPDQVATELGSFNQPNTGGWSAFVSAPLRNAAGEWVKVSLAGERTLRFTMGNGNANLNYLTVVPVGSIRIPPAGVAGPLPPLNGSEPIGPEFLSGYVPPTPPENPGNNAGGAP